MQLPHDQLVKDEEAGESTLTVLLVSYSCGKKLVTTPNIGGKLYQRLPLVYIGHVSWSSPENFCDDSAEIMV